MKKTIVAIFCTLLIFAGCARDITTDQLPTECTEEVIESVDQTQLLIDEIMADMTLGDKICQMMFVTPESLINESGVVTAGESTKAALEKYPVGGIIYFAENIKNRPQITQMISNSMSYSDIPLFIGVDEEGGRVARIAKNPLMGTTHLPAMKHVKTKEDAYSIGLTLGREIKELLFNVDFAPVADVLVNDENREIGDRSFGKDPLWVSDMVSEVVRGLEENSVSSVLKHFPGHGSTVNNSHNGYSESTRTLDELRQCEFLPFKKGIESGCDFVMVSHMTLVNVDEKKLPCSLSEKVITGLLKGELGFEGIVITDSLSMGAITKEYSAEDVAVMAVKAGADMLLMPKDIVKAFDSIKSAVESGEIQSERIDESVRKILKIKIEKGLF